MLIDADTMFEDGVNVMSDIFEKVVQGETYYCIMPANEIKPCVWRTKKVGNVWVPQHENGDTGTIAVYNTDFIKSNGFSGSEFMKARGELWGGHDGFIDKKLKSQLKRIRFTEPRIWLRKHKRSKSTKWFSKAGHSHFGKQWL